MTTMAARSQPLALPGGWPLVLGNLVVALAYAAGVLLVLGADEAGWRVVVRTTPRVSILYFLAAFAARPLARLAPSPVTTWLLRQRRYLGVSFAVWHLTHGAALIGLATTMSDFGETVDLTTRLFGGGAYVAIVLMVATSFDRPAALLGRRAWVALHTAGIYLLWLDFTVSYGGRWVQGENTALAATLTVLLLAGLGLRIAARG